MLTLLPEQAVVSLPHLIEWIVLPSETISPYGSWHGRHVSEEIAVWFLSQSSFTKYGHIQRDGRDFYLWRLSDWLQEYEQIKQKKDTEIHTQIKNAEQRERFARLVKDFFRKNPNLPKTDSFMANVKEGLALSVEQAEKGHIPAREELEHYGYYEELD